MQRAKTKLTGLSSLTFFTHLYFMKRCIFLFGFSLALSLFSARAETPTQDAEIAALKAQVERLRGMVPDQAHAMQDVAYHFTNLWFAGDKENWPLAQFYLNETRSHLHWAVRIIPVRKTPEGKELRLADLLGGMEQTVLKELEDSITAKKGDAFREKYQQTLASCYACHSAAGKPYLRLQIPQQPESRLIRFEPEP
jgi:hypothetical protein